MLIDIRRVCVYFYIRRVCDCRHSHIPVAAAEGCVRLRSNRKASGCGFPENPHSLVLRRLRRRTQPAAAATRATPNTVPELVWPTPIARFSAPPAPRLSAVRA
ncbi:hypothetical protein C7A07_16685 [Pseudomonas fragi]|nr:hypothetical protein C7A07_16685 [Pseudomonas fragi]